MTPVVHFSKFDISTARSGNLLVPEASFPVEPLKLCLESLVLLIYARRPSSDLHIASTQAFLCDQAVLTDAISDHTQCI